MNTISEKFSDEELSDITIKPSYYAQAKKWNNIPSVIDVSYDKNDNFIESVMLDPRSPDWFDTTVKLFCANHEIDYIGKSKLYSRY